MRKITPKVNRKAHHCPNRARGRRNPQTIAQASRFLASEWHPTKNGALTPDDVPIRSRQEVWWYAEDCKHEWKAAPNWRYHYPACPVCRKLSAAKRRNKQVKPVKPFLAS